MLVDVLADVDLVELGRITSIPVETFERWLAGTHAAPLSEQIRVAAVLDTDAARLFLVVDDLVDAELRRAGYVVDGPALRAIDRGAGAA